jgi:hypothetical protein
MNKLEELKTKLTDLIAAKERASAAGRTKQVDGLSKDITQLRSRIKSMEINK